MAVGEWTLVACDGSGNALAELTRAAGTSPTFARNGVPECTLSLSHDDAECATILDALAAGTGNGVPTLKGYRVGRDGSKPLRFNGYLAAVSEESGTDASTATFTFRGPFGRLLGEGSGRGRFLTQAAAFTAMDAGTIAVNLLSARLITATDDFSGLVGALNGRVAPLGGTWATSGATTDFVAGTAMGVADVERSTSADSGFPGRVAILGSTAYTDTAVQVDFLASDLTASSGVILRWVDSSNFVSMHVAEVLAGLILRVFVGGSLVAAVGYTDSAVISAGVVNTIRGSITTDGLATVTCNGFTVSLSNPALATGGVLASGKPGILDRSATPGPTTRSYTRFVHSSSASPGGATGVGIGTIQTSKTRDRNYPAQTNTGEAITALSSVLDGYDFEVAPVDSGSTLGLFNVYARQGSDKPGAKFEYGPGTLANCSGLHRQTLPPINAVTAVGANGLASTKSDTASISKYGRFELVQQFPDVAEQTTLDDKAYALLRPNPVKTVDFTPDPRLAPSPWDDYWIGDTVYLYANRGALTEGPTPVRVNQISVVVDPASGLETDAIPDPTTPDEERTIRASLQAEVIE